MDTTPPNKSQSNQKWIAIEPPLRLSQPSQTSSIAELEGPPTFRESQFDIILRRQRPPPGLKSTTNPSRFLNLSNEFEFAGWGTRTNMELTPADCESGQETLRCMTGQKILGQLMASGLAGNDILGGVFYTLPAVVAVSSVYSPISLLIATSTFFFWRPIMSELASALPFSGAPYTYLLNVSSKSLSMLGASLLLLDFTATTVVSAATTASYVAGEVKLPFPMFVVAIFYLVLVGAVALGGVKGSSRVAFAILSLHMLTMAILAVASMVAWGKAGNSQLRDNWKNGQAPSAGAVIHQIFNGVCLGMLGLTGVEAIPAYIAHIKPGRFPLVLRNLHIPAIVLNTVMMLLALAVLPLETLVTSANMLSVLAEIAAGRWLRILVVVDAIIVLVGVGLAGIFSACEMLEQLAHDRIIPKVFLTTLPYTGSHHVAVLAFVVLSATIYGTSGASLSVVSNMFTLAWLFVVMLFPLSLLLLKFNRGRLPREPQTSLGVIFGAISIGLTIIGGNIAIDPTTAGYFAAYFVAVLLIIWSTQNKAGVIRWVYWAYDQSPALHTWRLTRGWGSRLIGLVTLLRKQPVCILAKTDEINYLLRMVNYVRQNEETSCLKIVHFAGDNHKNGGKIPPELEANAKILDEAFPEITIDLILVEGPFMPSNVAALAHRLKIPRSLMFMSCPGDACPYTIGELGTRIVTL